MFYDIFASFLQKMNAKSAKLSMFLDNSYQLHKEINGIGLNLSDLGTFYLVIQMNIIWLSKLGLVHPFNAFEIIKLKTPWT